MPTVFALQLNDAYVAPALELMRRLVEPDSKSLPHITVRYSPRQLAAEDRQRYVNAAVSDVHMVEPGAFYAGREVPTPKTVFLRCASHQLELLAYKPDFPDSVFHVTIYDGDDNQTAAATLDILREYPWNLHISLPLGTHLIELNQMRKVTSQPSVLSYRAGVLAADQLGLEPTIRSIAELPAETRLAGVRRLCDYIHAKTPPRNNPSSKRLWRATTIQHNLPSPWVATNELPFSEPQRTDVSKQRFARALGLFVTPPEVAIDLVDYAVDLHPQGAIQFADPAIGSGIMFAALANSVGLRRISSAKGVEIDVDRAASTEAKWSRFGLAVEAANFLDLDFESDRTLLVANPPYMRFQKLSKPGAAQWRRRILADLDLKVPGTADLYAYFVLHAHRWLAPGAVSAWLLPAELTRTTYGSPVRDYLTRIVTLERLHLFGDDVSQFDNARVSSCAIFFRNTPPTPKTEVLITQGGTIREPVKSRLIPAREMGGSKKWPDFFEQGVGRPDGRGCSLGELFEVRRGIATGANDKFLLTARQCADLGVDRAWVKPVIPKSRYLRSNVIEGGDDGEPLVSPLMWLIDVDSPRLAAAKSPLFGAYLAEIEVSTATSTLVSRRKIFSRQERRPPPPFFFSYMARQKTHLDSRFFLNRSDGIILNNYLALYPRSWLVDLLNTGVVSYLDLWQVLRDVDGGEFSLVGRSYLAGLQKVEPSELSEIQLSGLPSAIVDHLRQN